MIYILTGIIAYLILTIILQNRENRKAKDKGTNDVQWVISFYTKCGEAKEQAWNEERQQLLDRIQAPSFDHLKQAEVRIIKAQKEEPAIKYDLV